MHEQLEAEIRWLRAEVIRLDNEVMALKAQGILYKDLTATIQQFWTVQWPAFREDIGQVKNAVDQMERVYEKIETLEGKLDAQNTSTWKLYTAVAVLATGSAAGGGLASQILSTLFGG